MLHLVVYLTPPENTRGVFQGYELVLLTSNETCIDCEITQGQHFLVRPVFFHTCILVWRFRIFLIPSVTH